MFNKGIITDSILGTLFIILLILVFQTFKVIGRMTILDPIGDAIGDVEMTDLVFSQLRQDPPIDKNIVLVNIGDLSRRDIARELHIINKYQPAIIGIDSYFRKLKPDTLGDVMLHNELSVIDNLVLVNELIFDSSSQMYDSVAHSNPYFNVGVSGYANLETNALEQHQFKVCRSFPPKRTIHGSVIPSFSVKVCQVYDAKKTQKFLDRDLDYEVINFRGNAFDFGQTKLGGRYIALDVNDVLNERFTPEVIKDKIVLFGYMGHDFNDKSWEDKFYTPLNVKYAGRSNPDMFGLVIHANIISMILNEDFIAKQGKWSGVWTAILICFFTVLGFTWIYRKLPHWYDGLTKSIQIIEVFILLTINVFVFHWFNYKTNLTLATIMVALAGDSLEVCYGLIKNMFAKKDRRLLFKVYNE